jgi:hypothetical protein
MSMLWKRGLIAGLANLVLGFGINQFVMLLLPAITAEYQNEAMFRPWSDPLMMVYFAYPFILGVVAAYLWERVGKPKPFDFAKLYFLIATIPGMFITYTSFQISFTMVLLWAATGFVEVFVAGLVFVRVGK